MFRIGMARSSTYAMWLGASVMLACGAEPERYAPPSPDEAATTAPAAGTVIGREESPGQRASEGVLSFTAHSSLQRQLDLIRYVVRDAYGDVVVGGEDEAAESGAQDRAISLVLPAGAGLTLELSTTTRGAASSMCRASLGPIDIEAGSTAKYQVFVWRCEGAPGAQAPEPECYWLADWFGVTRTRAAVGEHIGLCVAGHDERGALADVEWFTPVSSRGRFEDARAARTSFRCAEPSVAVPIGIVLSDGRCRKELTELVACQVRDAQAASK